MTEPRIVTNSGEVATATEPIHIGPNTVFIPGGIEARIAPSNWELRRVNEHTVDWFPVPLDESQQD